MTGEGALLCPNNVDTHGIMNMNGFQDAIAYAAYIGAMFAIRALGSMNLDNRMQEPDASPCEGDTDMASKFRATYTYTDAQGKQHTIRLNGQSKQDTDLQFQEFLGQPARPAKKTGKTLRQFVLEDYRPTFTTNLCPTTLKSYTMYEENYIFPNIGDKPLDTITVKDIQALMDWLAYGKKNGLQKNIVAGTIDRVKGHLSTIFEIAKEMGLIRETPVKNKLLKNNGEDSSHHKAMLPAEYADVRKKALALSNPRHQLYACLLAYTGMRIEEILGLKWELVNLDGGYGYVQEVVTYPDKSLPYIDPNPKTESSARTVILPPPVVDVFRKHAKPSGFVLSAGRNAQEAMPYVTYQRMYRETFRELGIYGRYTNHDFRASYATWLKESGVEISSAADLMGHKDTRMMSRVYAPTRHESIIAHQNLINSLVENQLVVPA